MLESHKVSALILKLLIIFKSYMLIIKLLYSNLFPVVEYSLLNYISFNIVHGVVVHS